MSTPPGKSKKRSAPRSDTPLTASGSPCKLCSAKGSPCHHHSPRKKISSIERSPKKNLSPVSPGEEWPLQQEELWTGGSRFSSFIVHNDSEDRTCGQIRNNYINAVIQFYLVAKALLNNKDAKGYKSFRNSLKTAVKTIGKDKNYTYPSLKALNTGIQTSSADLPKKLKKIIKGSLKNLRDQTKAAGTRVKQWKEGKKGSACREQAEWNCLLGQPDTKCGFR